MRERLFKRAGDGKCSALLSGMILILFLMCLPKASYAASERSVKVTLPSFPVTINGFRENNSYRQYPVIVYGDITYIPMTYYDCRLLGLETKWSQNGGLEINETGVSSSRHDQKRSRKNNSSYTAVIPTFSIRVNNNVVQNTTETYPLLSFRGVTYFPITWEYAVNQFGWKYHFDGKDGLVIQSSNIPVQMVQLPMGKKAKKSQSGYLITMAHGNYYYQGDGGAIYQAPVADPAKSKKIYQIEYFDTVEGFEYLFNQDGDAHLVFETGYNASMGENYDLTFHKDGTVTDQHGFRNEYISYENGVIYIPFNHSRLVFRDITSSKERNYGKQNERYDGPLHVKDGFLYALFDAAAVNGDYGETQGLCRINLATNESQVLAKQDVMSYQMVGDQIFYRSLDCSLHMLTEKDGSWQEKKLDVGTLTSHFEPVGGDSVLFFGTVENGGTHLLCYTPGKGATHINGAASLDKLVKSGGCIIAAFQENKDSQYRIMVFDGNGKQVFYSADTVKDPQVCDGTLLYVNSEGAVCTAHLLKSVPAA